MNSISSFPFLIEFQIFNPSHALTDEQKKIKLSLEEDLENILKQAIKDIPEYKYLLRCEPAISSLDEKKQIRFDIYNYVYMTKKSEHSIYLNQYQSTEYLSADELYHVSKNIQVALEGYLGYSINKPIISIDISYLNK